MPEAAPALPEPTEPVPPSPETPAEVSAPVSAQERQEAPASPSPAESSPHEQVLLADAGPPATSTASSAFTPLRTMVVVAIVAAGASVVGGRAVATLSD